MPDVKNDPIRNLAVHHRLGRLEEFLDRVGLEIDTTDRTASNADVMRHSHLACHAGAIAWMLRRKLTFDPAKETFIGDEEANRMRTWAKRDPWRA